MSFLRGFLHRIWVVLRGERYAHDQEQEQAFHRSLEAMHQSHAGASTTSAALSARRRFGNPTVVREDARRVSALGVIDRLGQDVRYAWRGLRRAPGMSVAIVLTFALGVGTNAAIFSLLNRLLLQPPGGVRAPHEVRRLYQRTSGAAWGSAAPLAHPVFSYRTFTALRGELSGRAQVALGTRPDSSTVDAGTGERIARRVFATAEWLPLLVSRPALGRFYTADEDAVDAPAPVAVLSHSAWQRVYAGESGVIGKTIRIGSTGYTVIGVARRGFRGIEVTAADVWVPLSMRARERPTVARWYETGNVEFDVIVRPAPGVTVTEIEARATLALLRELGVGPTADTIRRVLSGPLIRERGPVKRPKTTTLTMRLAAVAGIVLLIACANVANLLLARATRRRREIAVRLSLGVSRRRLFSQLLTESLVLSISGGVVALAFAWYAGSVLRSNLLPRVNWEGSVLDLRVTSLAIGVSVLCGLLAGLAPCLSAVRTRVNDALKSGSRDGTYQRSALRTGLLIAQSALSVVAVAGAGLFLQSLRNVQGIDVGFDPRRIVVGAPSYSDNQRHPERSEALRELAGMLRTVEGVEGAALGNGLPWYSLISMPVVLPGQDSAARLPSTPALIAVSPEYFTTTGIHLVAGRPILDSDREGAENVAVVNESLARALWPGENAIGKCLKNRTPANPCLTVVGIVRDPNPWNIVDSPNLIRFVPLAQRAGQANDWLVSAIVVRTAPERAAAVVTLLRRELKRLLPAASPEVSSLNARFESELNQWRLSAALFTAFGALALFVAAMGIYSVVAYTFGQRMHELGVRMALGARGADIVSLVLVSTARVTALGALLGAGLAFAFGRFVESLLYGVHSRDPLTIGAAGAVLVVVGVVAGLLPARRAAGADPVVVLRAE